MNKLPFVIDRGNGATLIKQLVSGFRQAIELGVYRPGDILGNRYPAFVAAATVAAGSADGTAAQPCELTLVPYFAWCHRGDGEMQTWFPVK